MLLPTRLCLLLYTCLIVAASTAGCDEASPPTQPETVVTLLTRLLQDPDPEVRHTAALSLGKIGRPEAAPALIAQVTDPDPQVRRSSAWALGNLGEEVTELAGPALAGRLWDSVADVRAAAAQALGQLKPSPAVLALMLKATRDGDAGTRLAAIQALGWLEAPDSFAALIQSLKDSDPAVRQAAVAALGELGDQRASPFLAERLSKDRDPGVRSEAAFWLGMLDGQAAESALRTATRDTDPRVRAWARAALESVSENQSKGDNGPGRTEISGQPT